MSVEHIDYAPPLKAPERVLFLVPPIQEVPKPLPELSERELQILVANIQGLNVKDISRALQTSRGINQSSIYKKLAAQNITQAASRAIKDGIVVEEMVGKIFDFSIIDTISADERAILHAVTTTSEENTNKAIAKRLAMKEPRINHQLVNMYDKYDLTSRPKAAAFYLFAAKRELWPDDTTEFTNQTGPRRHIPELPPLQAPWKPKYLIER